ncbi:MAG: tRNA (adenosine(37)-N6)-threonylcarbamoyltransferase complex ATPase subunit type 1 TsaE [Acidimicrobiales bacterium]
MSLKLVHSSADGGLLVMVALTAQGTRRCGACVAEVVQAGDIVLLSGELGAGKTTFAQGLAHALGVDGPVTSPTFVLLHSYATKRGWDLLHADVWRLQQLQEVVELAVPELVEQGAAAVMEWGERAAGALPADCLHVTVSFERPGAGSNVLGAGGARRLELRAAGPSWQPRLGELARLAKEAAVP